MRLLTATLLSLCLLSLPARAQTAPGQVVYYNIYTGGLKMLTAAMTIDDPADDDFRVAMKARTDGLISVFTDWEGNMQSTGAWAGDGNPGAVTHKAVSVWPRNTQVKEFAWNGDGALENFTLTETETGTDESLADIDPALAHGSVDLLTAALGIMQTVARTGSCAHSEDVFDGKRRFTLSAVDQGVENLSATRFNKYSGPARKCAIHVTPRGGNWNEKLRGWMAFQDRDEEAGTEPVVWLAQLEQDSPAVPVKVRAQTSFGTFFAHLAGYR